MPPHLPPAYAPIAVAAATDPLKRAVAAARDEADDGAFYWSRRADRADAAVVLVPDGPAEDALGVACVAMVGLGDALGALLPPGLPVHFRWPDQLLVNAALAGGLRTVWREGWIVVAITVAIAGRRNAEEPGRRPDRTTLADEGAGEVGAREVLETFSRHFLAWVNRWSDDGFAPVREAWLGRSIEREEGGESPDGRMIGMDEQGGLILDVGGKQQHILSLAEALKAPSWLL